LIRYLRRDPAKAERLVNRYGAVLEMASNSGAAPAYLADALPAPEVAITEAIKTLALYLKIRGELTPEFLSQLTLGYSSLASFTASRDEVDFLKEWWPKMESREDVPTDVMLRFTAIMGRITDDSMALAEDMQSFVASLEAFAGQR
jgi:hypothetical protein